MTPRNQKMSRSRRKRALAECIESDDPSNPSSKKRKIEQTQEDKGLSKNWIEQKSAKLKVLVEEEKKLDKMTCKELKELCKTRGLKRGGNRDQSVTRLLDNKSASLSTNKSSNKSTSKSTKRVTAKMVHKMLKDAGIAEPEEVNPCLKKGIQQQFYTINGKESLKEEVGTMRCHFCSSFVMIRLKDCLYQDANGADYAAGSEEGAIKCTHCKSQQYITKLCEGYPRLDSGKYHNHCTDCRGFGKCIDDVRYAHCEDCNKHFRMGSTWDICPKCARKADNKEELW